MERSRRQASTSFDLDRVRGLLHADQDVVDPARDRPAFGEHLLVIGCELDMSSVPQPTCGQLAVGSFRRRRWVLRNSPTPPADGDRQGQSPGRGVIAGAPRRTWPACTQGDRTSRRHPASCGSTHSRSSAPNRAPEVAGWRWPVGAARGLSIAAGGQSSALVEPAVRSACVAMRFLGDRGTWESKSYS